MGAYGRFGLYRLPGAYIAMALGTERRLDRDERERLRLDDFERERLRLGDFERERLRLGDLDFFLRLRTHVFFPDLLLRT